MSTEPSNPADEKKSTSQIDIQRIVLYALGAELFILSVAGLLNLLADWSAVVQILFNILQAILITIISSWGAYKISTMQSHNHLRGQAIQAAQKVVNMSKQLNHLSEKLMGQMEWITNDETPLNIKYLNMSNLVEKAADEIKIIESMNENSLLDWQSIIDAELSLWRDAQIRTQYYKRQLEELYSLPPSDERSEKLSKVLEKAREVAASSPIPIDNLEINPSVTCPYCNHLFDVTGIPARYGDTKHVTCPECDRTFPVHRLDSELRVGSVNVKQFETHVSRELKCPNCHSVQYLDIKSTGKQLFLVKCIECTENIQVIASKGLIERSYIPQFKHIITCPACNIGEIIINVNTPFDYHPIVVCTQCDQRLRTLFRFHQLEHLEVDGTAAD